MRDRARAALVVVRRASAIAALSLWIGFVTIYGAIVVPLGARVLGSATAQGFVTQAVTARVNAIAVIALVVLAWNALRTAGPRRALAATWAVMVIAQVALFVLHPYVGALLDDDARRVVDRDEFYARHRVYLLVTAAQWLAALAHAALAVSAWRDEDRGARGA